MQDEIHRLPQQDRYAGCERFVWNGYSFPVLPSLDYHADGPDKKNTDRLFIADRSKRFMFYFESGFDGLKDNPAEDTDYKTIEAAAAGRNICICYPQQKKERKKSTGYFRITLQDRRGEDRICAGSLGISAPKPYFEGLKEYTELCAVFTGIEMAED